MAGSHGRMFRSVYWRFLVHNGYVQPRHTKSSKRQNTMFLQQCHELNQTNVTSCFVFSTFWWYLGCLNFTLNTLVSRVKSMSRHLQRQHSAEHCWIQQPLRDLTSSFSWKCSSFYAWKVTWFVSKALYLHLPKLGPLRSALIVFQQDMSQCLCLLFKQFWLHVTWSICNIPFGPWNIRFGWPSSFFTIGFCCSKLQLRLQLSWHHSFESNSSLSLLVAISESRSRVVISRAWNHIFAVNPQYPRNLIDRNTFFQGSLRTAPITRCLCWTHLPKWQLTEIYRVKWWNCEFLIGLLFSCL